MSSNDVKVAYDEKGEGKAVKTAGYLQYALKVKQQKVFRVKAIGRAIETLD